MASSEENQIFFLQLGSGHYVDVQMGTGEVNIGDNFATTEHNLIHRKLEILLITH